MNPPVFSRSIKVDQVDGGAGGIWVLVVLSTVLVGPVLAGGAWFMDREGAVGALGGGLSIALAFVMLLVSLAVWMWVDTGWRALRGKPALFSATTQVDIDQRGISVQSLGHVDWPDVLAIESIPDSSTHLVVHTRTFQKLMLAAPLDELAEVVQHYLAQKSVPPVNDRSAVLRTRAVVFSWPRFMAWIWTGYAVAGALGLAVLLNANDVGFLKTLVALGVLMPLSAWLMWMVPFAQLNVFAPSRVRAFELEGAALRSTDDAWRIDLRRARIGNRQVSGIGYDFSFISVRPHKGARLDLLLPDDDRRALIDVLQQRGLMQPAVHTP
ncbi:hypothetical protein VLK31_15510 [Variovorax sp. H27-G14]|uniref:hypothetical protein n=1 Tax=Variovorax sp. H27-G14 TaxID=3111914 RepID=UPI0038FC2FB4